MRLTVFDDNSRNNFFPICCTRSIGDIRCGILKLRQRLQNLFETDFVSVIIDQDIEDLYRERHPDWKINLTSDGDTIYLNSRIVLDSSSFTDLQSLIFNTALLSDNEIVALRTDKPIRSIHDISDLIDNQTVSTQQSHIRLYNSVADIIHDNPRLIEYDYREFFYDSENYIETEPGVTLLDPYNIWIGEGTKIKPGVVLDGSGGAIVIDNDVVIMSNVVICGPAYIGKKSTIKIGAKIYPGTSIGPMCKIGGEVEGSIFHAYSNKQHEGFIGHSYVGEWVNIGADTNNSDLKNTYKNVYYYSYAHKKKVDSGSMFLGAIIGDHVKFGINCTINTGAVIGTGSNLWGNDLISDYIPPLSWGMANSLNRYRIDAFLETVELVKQRRGLHLSISERDLFRQMSDYFLENN